MLKYFFQKIGFDISYMKCQTLFSGKCENIYIYMIILLSAEYAHSMVMVKC